MNTNKTFTLSAGCPSCSTEIGLDAFMQLCISDAAMRGLVADLVAISLPMSADVMRYLRLFKPATQALKTETVRRVLAELVPAIKSGQIEAKGRLWPCAPEGWRAGFAAVFAAAESGKLKTPLAGNAYLFGVLANLANQLEAKQEQATEQARRTTVRTGADKGLQNLQQTLSGHSPMPAELREKFQSITHKKGTI